MIISNYKSTPHYLPIDRKFQYSQYIYKEFIFKLYDYFEVMKPSLVISDGSPLWGWAIIEAAYTMGIKTQLHLPYMGYSITWNDDLKNRFENIIDAADSIFYNDFKRYGDWKHNLNYETIIIKSDIMLFNQSFFNSSDNYIWNRCLHYNKKPINLFDKFAHKVYPKYFDALKYYVNEEQE